MTAHSLKPQSPPLRELAVIVAAGIGCAGLFRAAQAVAHLVTILECSGAIGGTRGPSTS